MQTPVLRRIKHEGRGAPGSPLWVSSWLAPFRCTRDPLRKYLQELVDAKTITLEGKKSGSGIHTKINDCCKMELAASPFADLFVPLKELRTPQKKMHYQIEKQMMLNVDTVVATELPLATAQNEGLVDVLLDTKECVYVLDYKPGARTTNAIGQLSCYAILISDITGIPLSEFRVGWFDEYSFWKGYPDPEVRSLLT
jgi:hypothetical protein